MLSALKLTWFQFFLVPTGSFFHRFTRSTQALQISPDRLSLSLEDNFSLWWGGKNGKSLASIWRAQPKKPWQVWFACSPAHAQVYLLPKATPEVFLIALAVCETRAWRLCTADAAAVQTPVHFRLVKAKHLHSGEKKGGLNVYIWSVCTECLLLQQQEEVGVEENTPFTPTFAVQVRGEAQISVKSAVSGQKCV